MNPLCCIAPVSVDREKPPTGNVIGKPPDIVFEPLKNQQHHSQITGNNGGINLGFSRHSYSAQVSSVSSSTTALDQVHHHEAEDVMVMSGRDSRVYGSNGGGAIAGILYKWVNYGKGWRSRWFVLEDGVLSYYKLHGPDKITVSSSGSGSGPGSSPRREKIGVKVIGEESVKYMRKNNSWGKNGTNNISGISANYSNGFRVNNSYSNLSTYNKQWKPYGEVHLKVSSIRASKSDDKRLSIFTGTKTLHLRCVSKEDRATWIESLLAAKDLFPRVLTSNEFAPEDIVVSTDKLRRRMLQEGIAEPVIDDCESIVLIEVSELKNQFKALQQKHVSLLETLRRLEYNSGAHHNSNNTMAPSTLTMQGTGHEQSMYFPLYRLPLASSYDEVQVNRPEVVDARNQPAQRENQRQLLEEDDFMVSIFSQPGIKLYNGKTQNNMHEGGRNHKGSGHSTALPSPGEKETDQRNRGDLNSKQQMKNLDGRSSRVYDAPARHSSDVLMREKDDWRKDACAQSGYPDRYRVINLEKTNSNLRQDHEDGVSATGATHLVGVSDQPLEYPGKEISLKLNHAPPVGSNYRGDNETGNGMQRVEEYRTLEKESLDRGDDVSETSMEDTSELDITPDDVVRIIGRKHFWKARTAISTQQRLFAVQIFELHRLIKVQKLIAESPDLLLEGTAFVGKSSLKDSAVKKYSSDYAVKALAHKSASKDDSHKATDKMEGTAENAVAKSPPVQTQNAIQPAACQPSSVNIGSSFPPANMDLKMNPWSFHQPGPHQWLVPVMSPSEGLVYKPYPAPGFTGPVCGPEGLTPVMNPAYAMPTPPYLQGMAMPPGMHFGGQGYFPPYGMPMMSPSVSGSTVEQFNQFSGPNPYSQTGQPVGTSANFGSMQHQGSFNMPSQKNGNIAPAARPRPPRERELQGSTASSPSERTQETGTVPLMEGRDALPLFPAAPTTQISEGSPTDKPTRVIRVVPQKSTRESAARIFQSIQDERRHYEYN